MKRIVLITIAVIILLPVAALIIIPVFFKPALLEAVKSSINKQVNAEVQFGEFELSLFRNFPKATIVIHQLSVTGKGEFAGDTLLQATTLKASMNLFSLFKKSGRNIEEIVLEKPHLNFIINQSGQENWDITVSGNVTQGTQQTSGAHETLESPFSLRLDKVQIENGEIVYTDVAGLFSTKLTGIQLDIKGQMYGTTATLDAAGEVADFIVNYDSVAYISNTGLKTKSKLSVDYEPMKISIMENELFVNQLPMQVTGNIEMPSDSMFYNLEFSSKESGFENFLALVPAEYAHYLKDIKTTGKAEISGALNGLWYEENYPAFNLAVQIYDASLQGQHPEKMEKIKGEIVIDKPQGILDLTQIKIINAHCEINGNPINLALEASNLFADPVFNGNISGKADFGDIKNIFGLDSMNIAGLINSQLAFAGKYSDVETEKYENIKFDGIVQLTNFIYDSPEFTQEIEISKGDFQFSPASVAVNQFDVKIGDSDFAITGKGTGYLGYMLNKGDLKGDFLLISKYSNINQLLRLQEVSKTTPAPKTKTEKTSPDNPTTQVPVDQESLSFDIPSNINLTFRSQINRAIFDKIEMENLIGLITATNGKLLLNGLSMNTLGGELKLTGSYQNTPQKQPLVDFTADIRNFDIPLSFNSLPGIQKLAPVVQYSQGKINTQINFNGRLQQNFKIIPSSVDGNALIATVGLKIINSPIFNQLKGIIASEKLQNVNIDDFTGNCIITNGNIDLKPFKTKVAGQETTIAATLSAEEIVNMRLDFKVNRDAFGPDISKVLGLIPGNPSIEWLPAGVIINGPVNNPSIKMDLTEAQNMVTNAAKNEIQNTVKKVGKELQKLFGK